MPDTKITDLATGATPDIDADWLVYVDVSDTSMAASGTNKKSLIRNVRGGYFTLEDFGAVGDGSTNDTTAINLAFTTLTTTNPKGAVVYGRPGKTYVTTTGITGRNGVRLDLDGAEILQTAGSLSTVGFTASESGASTTLTANTVADDETITVTSTTGFIAGDAVVIRDTQLLWAAGGTSSHQVVNVIEVVTDATHLLMKWRVDDIFLTANTATVARLSPMTNCGVRNGTIRNTTALGGGVRLILAHDILDPFSNLTVIGGDEHPSYYLHRCRGITNHSTTCRDGLDVLTGGDSYGFAIYNSRYIQVFNHNSYRIRENTAHEGSRRVLVSGGWHQNNHDSAWNTHGGNCRFITFENLEISGPTNRGIAISFSGADDADHDIVIRNNRFHGCSSYQCTVGENTPRCKRVSVENNDFLNPNASTTAMLLLRTTDEFEVSNNRFMCPDHSYGGRGMTIDDCDEGYVSNNRLRDLTTAYGMVYQGGCVNVEFRGNNGVNIGSDLLRHGDDTCTKIRWINNRIDDLNWTAGTTNPPSVRYGNMYNLGQATVYRDDDQVFLTAAATGLTSATLSTITGMTFNILSGVRYHFKFIVKWQTSATTSGLRMAVACASVTSLTYMGAVSIGADGVDSVLFGQGTASADTITGGDAEATVTNYTALLEGMITPSANTTMNLQCANEAGAGTVTVGAGTCGFLKLLG